MVTSQLHQPSFFYRHRFWLLLLAAATLRHLPIVSLPFNWLESYFHEISHGLAAIIAGGKIIQIELFPNGAGLCTTQGGSRLLTAFMGYSGAAIWGAAIYSLSSVNQRVTQLVTASILILLVLSCIFWVRDILTLIILAVLIALFALKVKFYRHPWLNVSVQLVGLTVLLNALFSPLYLIDGRHRGDGATLAGLTGMPEILWVAIWLVIAVVLLYRLAKQSNKRSS
ncbi:M50 family peptidase [Thalassotalea euphylliae]|uniref:M50 family peptidase n=1 Tax=Thalassotalea euphylliae TaxID=1655234 RepID=A0A3E0TQ31_9GAMM|nr:M50 family peptidase [Thalassotalea euphylliae]